MLRISAKFISFLFHPLLILTYILTVLILIDPYSFGASDISDMSSRVLILRVFLSTFFIPALAVAMLYFLGMVSSFDLDDKQDRTGPYIITGIFYLWLFRNFLDSSLVPSIFACFMLSATIALFLAFLINIFSKISIHAVGLGSLISMIILTMVFVRYNSLTFYIPFLGFIQVSIIAMLLFVIIIAGLVGTCRMYLANHEINDLFGGYLVGMLSPFVALQVMVFLGKLQLPY